jgi:coenzyme F420 hydrogenase subunit beta
VLKQKKTNIALVGTPCKIHAVRSLQLAGMKRYAAPVKFLIGLMCSECFTYSGLMENYIHGKLGINLADIRKMNIKGKMLVTTDSGVTPIPLPEIKQYARKSCSVCEDFSSELADISVGEELFSNAEKAGYITTKPLEEGSFAMTLLTKLSRKKREGPVAVQAQPKKQT